MRAGCSNAEQLCERSGAASHCGACMQMLTKVTGDPGGEPARAAVEELGPRLARVTLRPEVGDGFRAPLQPGQHIVLSLHGDDGWVSRTYTVASAAEELGARELLVRLRPDGRMAGALRRVAQRAYVGVRVGAPRGDAFAPLHHAAQTVFVVAGVGVTPALSALRSADGPDVRLVVAFLQEQDEALQAALQAACAAKGAALQIALSGGVSDRDTAGTATAWAGGGGSAPARLDLTALAREHAGVDWFVCGPPGFERLTRAQLRDGGVDPRRVHVERFLVAAQDATTVPARERTAAESRWSRVGLGLVGLWLLWAAAPSVTAWTSLQSSDAWRITTGATLVAALAWMWVFPVLRMRGSFDAAKRLERSHRVVGALSPLALLLHQRSLGFGLLCVLSGLWVLNTLLGCCDKTVIDDPERRARYARLWLPVHVVVSVVVTSLSVWHVAMVLLFRGGVT